jgi:hypothetical protein
MTSSSGTTCIPASDARLSEEGERPSRFVRTVHPLAARRLAIAEPIAPAAITAIVVEAMFPHGLNDWRLNL